jgi:hypothetical protein
MPAEHVSVPALHWVCPPELETVAPQAAVCPFVSHGHPAAGLLHAELTGWLSIGDVSTGGSEPLHA